MKRGTIICNECGKVINYVQGKRHKLSGRGTPEAVTAKEGECLTWDKIVKCPECGARNTVE